MSNENVNYVNLSYEEQIKYTQNLKQNILEDLMCSGMDGSMPTDKDTIGSIMKVIDSMDKTTLADRRNTIESESGASAKELLGAMSEFIKQAKNRNPFAAKETEELKGEVPLVPVEELGDFVYVEGQGEVGVTSEEFNKFNERMEVIHKAQIEEEAKKHGLE